MTLEERIKQLEEDMNNLTQKLISYQDTMIDLQKSHLKLMAKVIERQS